MLILVANAYGAVSVGRGGWRGVEPFPPQSVDTICLRLGGYAPKFVWHSIEVFEPKLIIEAKEDRYDEDGNEQFKIESSEAQQLG